jgi:hypothetical protein
VALHWVWVVYCFFGGDAKAGMYSAADVAWVVVQGFGLCLFGRKKRWGVPVEMYVRSPVPMEAMYGLTLGVGGVFFFFWDVKVGIYSAADVVVVVVVGHGEGFFRHKLCWGGPVDGFLSSLTCFDLIHAITLGVGVFFLLFFAVRTYQCV